MATLAELMEQRAQLDQQIEALRASAMHTATGAAQFALMLVQSSRPLSALKRPCVKIDKKQYSAESSKTKV
mgnify:CR=1 FL=1